MQSIHQFYNEISYRTRLYDLEELPQTTWWQVYTQFTVNLASTRYSWQTKAILYSRDKACLIPIYYRPGRQAYPDSLDE